jgi:hypothetical protein
MDPQPLNPNQELYISEHEIETVRLYTDSQIAAAVAWLKEELKCCGPEWKQACNCVDDAFPITMKEAAR